MKYESNKPSHKLIKKPFQQRELTKKKKIKLKYYKVAITL